MRFDRDICYARIPMHGTIPIGAMGWQWHVKKWYPRVSDYLIINNNYQTKIKKVFYDHGVGMPLKFFPACINVVKYNHYPNIVAYATSYSRQINDYNNIK